MNISSSWDLSRTKAGDTPKWKDEKGELVKEWVGKVDTESNGLSG